jgi:outer membrane protein assembly factor BamB
MRLKAFTGIVLTVFLLGILTLAFNVQQVAASVEVDWWPMFCHDLNRTGYSTSTAPNTNNTIWTYTTGGDVYSSPAVVDGRVYVGSDDNKVYCLEASTGAHIWNYTTGGGLRNPAVAGGKVYVGSDDDKVYCLEASTGAHIWNYTTGADVWSSPTVVDGKVYVGSWDKKVYCLEASTGAHIWNYTTGGAIGSSPTVADGVVYTGSGDNKVYCLDASTGAHIWNYTTGDIVGPSPAVVDGKVYVGSYDGKVYCLDASTGAHIWNYTTGDQVLSSAAVAGGRVYVGSYDSNFYCLDASTGALMWSYTTGDTVSSSPAVVGGIVYVGSWDDKVYAFGSLVLSTDSAGNSKATFDLSDDVYVRGEGFTADTSVTIYLIPDGADASPSNAVATASATTDTSGDLPATLVWSQPLTLGEYDVWVDENQNGVLDGADVWNSQSIGIYPLDVIPELFTLTSMLAIFIIITTAVTIYKRRQFKNPIH